MLKTYTVTIDRSGDNLMVTENNRLVYSSDYPIQEIESIQSEVGIGYGRLNSTSSLIIKLKNTHTKRVVYKVVIYFSRIPVTEIRYPSLRQQAEALVQGIVDRISVNG